MALQTHTRPHRAPLSGASLLGALLALAGCLDGVTPVPPEVVLEPTVPEFRVSDPVTFTITNRTVHIVRIQSCGGGRLLTLREGRWQGISQPHAVCALVLSQVRPGETSPPFRIATSDLAAGTYRAFQDVVIEGEFMRSTSDAFTVR